MPYVARISGRGRRTALRPRLTPEAWELLCLTQQVRTPTVTLQLALRARIILLLAQGATITAIARAVGLSRVRVYKWVQRWQQEGLQGLQDRKAGHPRGPRQKQAPVPAG